MVNIFSCDFARKTFLKAYDKTKEKNIIFNDVLSCGPLVRTTDQRDWKESRCLYWENIKKDNCCFTIPLDFDSDTVFYNQFDVIRDWEKISVWIGTGLSDQLLFAYIVTVLERLKFNLRNLQFYQFENITGKNIKIQGVWVLPPEQLRKNCPSPLSLTPKQIFYVKSAWEAIIASTPNKIIDFLDRHVEYLPFLKKALTSIIYRFPNSINGLTSLDQVLLLCVEKYGPETKKILAGAIYERKNDLDYVSDYYMFSRLKKLSSPQLTNTLVNANRLDSSVNGTQFTLLPFGRQALNNEVNAFKENGIDEWVGGIHLTSPNNLWIQNKGMISKY